MRYRVASGFTGLCMHAHDDLCRADELDIKCSVDVKLHAMKMLAERRNVANFGTQLSSLRIIPKFFN